MKKTVTLTEALCGFTTVVDHLDGRKIVISHPPGSVLVPGNFAINIMPQYYVFAMNYIFHNRTFGTFMFARYITSVISVLLLGNQTC